MEQVREKKKKKTTNDLDMPQGVHCPWKKAWKTKQADRVDKVDRGKFLSLSARRQKAALVGLLIDCQRCVPSMMNL